MTAVTHDPHLPTQTHAEVTRDVVATLGTPSRGYYLALFTAIGMFLIGLATFVMLLKDGTGLAGYSPPGFWLGLHHDLRLLGRHRPRRHADLGDPVPVPLAVATAVYRSTEAMTVFAVMTAALFPIIHIGRQWIFYWLLPYPNQRYLWPNFKSPLIWDVFAISTYFTVSTTFLVVGLVPDIAAVRDKVTGWRKKLYTICSLGWTGRTTSGGTTAVATSTSPRSRRRWCSRCTPSCPGTSRCRSCPAGTGRSSRPTSSPAPSTPASAWCSRCLIPLRKVLKLEHMITEYHFDNLAKLTLFTGSILFYAYLMEYFIAWYSGSPFEQTTFFRRAFGPMWWAGWSMIICNAFVSQLLWFKKVRTNLTALFVISIFVNIGMWFERFVIIASSLANDYLPYAWGQATPTWADWGILIGSFGWFGMYFLLFARTFPVVAIQEIKEMIPMPRRKGGGH
jgi:molybdopterin-containing oxidoreductase family membrane subunit